MPASAAVVATVPAPGKEQVLAYAKQGQGPAVVIVHGIGGHKEDWAGVAAELAKDHTVYAIDMIGFGASSKTADEITIRTQVDAIRALLDQQGVRRASLIGNSVGGWVAATFSSVHPDRVDKLIVADAAGFKAMFEGPSPVNFYPDTVEDMQKTLSVVFASPGMHTRAAAEQALAALDASGDKAAAERVFKGLFVSPRLEDVSVAIQAPTLVLWGAQDRLFPPGLADLVSGGIRGSRKQLIEGASHFPQLDNPAAFNAAVAGFLR